MKAPKDPPRKTNTMKSVLACADASGVATSTRFWFAACIDWFAQVSRNVEIPKSQITVGSKTVASVATTRRARNAPTMGSAPCRSMSRPVSGVTMPAARPMRPKSPACSTDQWNGAPVRCRVITVQIELNVANAKNCMTADWTSVELVHTRRRVDQRRGP